MSTAVRQEIERKTKQWKNFFKDGIEESTGIKIAENAQDLTYAQLFEKAKNTDFSVEHIKYMVSWTTRCFGDFESEEFQYLNTTGYKEATEVGNGFFFNQSESLAKELSPLITPADEDGTKKIGTILHYFSYPLVEIYYETDSEEEVSLPDIFILNGNQIVTIKAIRNLNDNPVFGKHMEKLENNL